MNDMQSHAPASNEPTPRRARVWTGAALAAAIALAMFSPGCEPWAYEPPAEKATAGPVDPDAPEEFTTTSTGLKYRIRRKGNGKRPLITDEVSIHYKGWLDDGTVFNNTYLNGQPTPLNVRRVVPGFSEGLQIVDEGGMIELEIPSNLGYGDKTMGNIPPGSTLHFQVEMLQVGNVEEI